MVLLKQRSLTFLVFLALATVGCALFRASQGSSFQFSHAQHQKVSKCEACHKPDGDTVGMPQEKLCMVCHKTIDNEKPPERKIATLFADGVYQGTRKLTLSDEVIFSHKNHTETHGVACAACHTDGMEATAITSDDRIDMQECATCHAKTAHTPAVAAGLDNCALCHQSLSRQTAPDSHKQNWERFHGQVARDGSQEGADQCSLCHTEESCNTCHQTQAPANHNNFWRERGHGVAVSMDRDNCAVCHQSDECASCHSTTAPRSHRGQWADDRNTHCMSCHFPVSAENCSVCHQNGTPSHALATPNPHGSATLDCRSCHTGAGAAPMPHVDDGSNCAYCHQ